MTTTSIDYWDLAQKGVLCDATLVEKTASGKTSTYTVHRLLLLQCPYFKILLENPLGEKRGDYVYTVITDAQDEPGHLAVVLQALYKGVSEYDCLLVKKDAQDVMSICILCDYLGLDSHVDKILSSIKKSRSATDMNKIAEWWSARHQRGLEVPDKINAHVQNYLRSQFVYHDSEPFISVNTLINILPDDHIRDFLSSTIKLAFKSSSECDDIKKDLKRACKDHPELMRTSHVLRVDPNNIIYYSVLRDEAIAVACFENDGIKPLTENGVNSVIPHPSLIDLETEVWMDPESRLLFCNSRSQWRVIAHLDQGGYFRVLTPEQKRYVTSHGWRYSPVDRDD